MPAILSTMAGLLQDRRVSEGQLLRGTGLESVYSLRKFGISAVQMDTVCTNALELSDDRHPGYALRTSPKGGGRA